MNVLANPFSCVDSIQISGCFPDYKDSSFMTYNQISEVNALRTGGILPGTKAQEFSVWTLNHGKVSYPSKQLPSDVPIGFHAFTNQSGFLECMWGNAQSLIDFVETSPENVNYVFMTFDSDSMTTITWMQQQIISGLTQSKMSQQQQKEFLARMFFVITPIPQIGNWIASILREWSCYDHGCGLGQVLFTNPKWQPEIKVLKRVDARYDWVFNHEWAIPSPQVTAVADACDLQKIGDTKNKVALVSDDIANCSVAQKVINLQKAESVGVLVYSRLGYPVQDFNCYGSECNEQVTIPAASIPYNAEIVVAAAVEQSGLIASLQTTSFSNYYFTIDGSGNVSEPGWFLYPSLKFLSWQMQWLTFNQNLLTKISHLKDYVVPVFDNVIMQGQNGTGNVTVHLNSIDKYDAMYLDASLSCPGDRDEMCPPWDHVATLYVCCDGSSLCGAELGRWITTFRRRIGHWITDVSAIMPLFKTSKPNLKCFFMMKVDAWWAQPWLVSLKLRFQKGSTKQYPVSAQKVVHGVYTIKKSEKPVQVTPLFKGGVFDKNYNKHYHPITFNVPEGVTSVKVYAVITGHGSDDFGCGEFCPTSHHFLVNGKHNFTKTFLNAGTPEGCADRVPEGVVPNEHGTWLYGRDGWCDGLQVDPWTFDISQFLTGGENTITYFGFYNGKDPNPSTNPGLIRMVSYLIYYMEK
ncbi:unnamed protein product [Clavelina lepadiformis]|uniref:Peptide-N-glycosidase F N-terminal domain-containing protein n=1 Tax=Clavelina lepadiformis TaxID=159417 RepID=A0ABP0GF40_CLALP